MFTTQHLRWGIYAALFSIPFVPFIIADAGGAMGIAADQKQFHFYLPFMDMYFPYITGKTFIFRILVGLMVGLFAILALREVKYRPRASMLLWALGGLVLWMGVATALSADPEKSLWSNFERMEGYVGLLHLFGYFMVAGVMLSADKLWSRFLNTTIAASVLMGVISLCQFLGWIPISPQSGNRVDATFGNAAYTGVYMLLHFFLTLFMVARRWQEGTLTRHAQLLYGAAMVLQLGTIYLTATRAAILGAVGGMAVVALYTLIRAQGREWRMMRRGALGVLGGIMILVGVFFAIRDLPAVRMSAETIGRLASISLEDRTTQSRFMIWQMAIGGSLERPLWGWGQENFSYIFNERYNPRMYDQEQWFDRAHNQFLDWLVAGGIPAFLLYISLFIIALYIIVRTDKLNVLEQAALVGLLAAYAFNNLLVFDNLSSSTLFFTVLALLYGISRSELPGSIRLSRPVTGETYALVAPAIAAACVLLVWTFNVPGMARATVVVDALRGAQRGSDGRLVARDPEDNKSQFERALGGVVWPGAGPGRQEVVEQYITYATRVITSDASPADKQSLYSGALRAAKDLLKDRPGDARLELFVAGYYHTAGKAAEALQHLEYARAASPYKQTVYFQQANTYLQIGETQKMIDALRYAFELEPNYDTARILYAGALHLAGRGEEGDALLRERYDSVIVDNNELLQIYMVLPAYDRAAAIWKERIRKNLDRADNYINLADNYINLAKVYYTAGQTSLAIEALREAARLDPGRAQEIESLIQQLGAER